MAAILRPTWKVKSVAPQRHLGTIEQPQATRNDHRFSDAR